MSIVVVSVKLDADLLVVVHRLWYSGYIEDKPLVTHVKILNEARRLAIAANTSFLTTAVRIPFSPL